LNTAEAEGNEEEGLQGVAEAETGDEDGSVLESPPGEELKGLGPTEEVAETEQVAQW